MNFLTIDKDLCNKDGICAEECPLKIIDIKDGFPAKMEGAEDLCLRCGHCVAVCPTGAFSLKGISPEESLPVNRDYLLDQAQARKHLADNDCIKMATIALDHDLAIGQSGFNQLFCDFWVHTFYLLLYKCDTCPILTKPEDSSHRH